MKNFHIHICYTTLIGKEQQAVIDLFLAVEKPIERYKKGKTQRITKLEVAAVMCRTFGAHFNSINFGIEVHERLPRV
jgi:hypothetical protein